MPLGSESDLGLAGPNGTPDIGELPAPAEPAGGVNCANALAGTIKASATNRTSAKLRDIEVSLSRGTHPTIKWGAGSLAPGSSAFQVVGISCRPSCCGVGVCARIRLNRGAITF
jgi:hypothetical protein